MSWAEVKHALNSTLGKTDFKPLDKIIYGEKQLSASDDVYKMLIYNLAGGDIPIYEGVVSSFVVQASGSIKIRGSADKTLYVRVNGDTVGTIVSQTSEVISKIEEGDEVVIRTAMGADTAVEYLYICATVVDGSLIEIQ